MRYELYTTVDITSTGQFRPGSDKAYQREQNFQTVLQTIGIRANTSYNKLPEALVANAKDVGLEVDGKVKMWKFEFETERDNLFEDGDSPVGYLIEDFDGVPYISGLDESMEQNFDVFVTRGKFRNIVFHLKK